MDIISILKKYKTIIAYGFWGVCTTAVNIAVYDICFKYLDIANIPSTLTAWGLSVIFAFITNKIFVFESKSFKAKAVIGELASFFGCRLLTGILDVAIMYIAVDVFTQPAIMWKIISNVIVIILNYVFSKLIIFKK